MKYWIIILYIFSSVVVSCSPTERLYKETRTAMYTIVSITVVSDSEKKAKDAIESAFRELDRLERLLNFYSNESEISYVNMNASVEPVKVSKDTIELIDKALYVSEHTNGAFDITMSPVIDLWDFKERKLPDEKMLAERLKLVGYRNIIIDRERSTVYFKKNGIKINPGGILKGYAADRAVDILKGMGINAGIVAIAGDIKTFGIRPDGKNWNIGIQNPRQKDKKDKSDEVFATISLSDDMAISTSGDYERFFENKGKRYHHILDPKTGYPAYGCQSVTVITKDAVFTDAFATGIFILGPKKGIDTLKKLGFDGVIVDKDGKILVTEGIKDRIKWNNGVLE